MKVLVIAPHPDDEIIGCGGTIAKRVANGDDVYVAIVTKGSTPPFSSSLIERGRKEAVTVGEVMKLENLFFLDIPTPNTSVNHSDMISELEDIIKYVRPEEIYIPHCGDIHSDHKAVAESALVASRPKNGCSVKRIYAYETVSETGWDVPNASNFFIPNVYEDITDFLSKKVSAYMLYESQIEAYPCARSVNAIKALAEYRGTTVGIPSAEAFMLIREVKP